MEARLKQTIEDPVAIASFEQMYERHWWLMLRIAMGLTGDRATAEDVVQDAFASVYRRWSAVDPDRAVGYLRTSVVNSARSALRRRMSARKYPFVVGDLVDEPADEPALRAAEHQTVRFALTTLPDRQREVLTLRYLAALDDEQIAAATGLSAGGVRSAASRGVAALRTKLGDML